MGFIKVSTSPIRNVHPDKVAEIVSFVEGTEDRVRVILHNGEEFVFPFGSNTAMQNWFTDLGNLTTVLDWADYPA